MAAKLNNLVVKDTGSKFSVYTTMPEGVVAPKLYTKLDSNASKAVVKAMQAFHGGYALKALKNGGRVTFGRKNTLKNQIRSIVKNGAATPGTEINSMQDNASTDKPKDPRFVKGTPEAKAHMAAIRAKAGKGNASPKQESNTTLVLSKEDASSNGEQSLRNAIKTALDSGDYATVEILVNKLHS